jgi:hypothetical protein
MPMPQPSLRHLGNANCDVPGPPTEPEARVKPQGVMTRDLRVRPSAKAPAKISLADGGERYSKPLNHTGLAYEHHTQVHRIGQ